MEINIKMRGQWFMDVIVTDGSTTIEYDPMTGARGERDIRQGFAEMMVDAAVDVVEFRKADTDTSDAIRRLFERLPESQKDELLKDWICKFGPFELEGYEENDNESVEALRARITELEEKIEALEARIAEYKFGEEE